MYDYVIIGTGAAGLQMAIAMSRDSFFNSKKILLLDKDEKNKNDKTWCYWEEEKGKWDNIIQHSWSKGSFYNDKKTVELKLPPYHYKMLKSIDFYNYAKKELSHHNNIEWLKENVEKVISNQQQATIKTNKTTYTSKLCFDSRIVPEYYKDTRHIKILQHFKGSTIKFTENLFDSAHFTMMDFRLRHKNSTSFMYVLPTADNEALFEFTLFTSEILEEKDYDHYIKKYINQYITTKTDYEITENEQGIIPMANFPFHKYSQPKNIKIGAAGSWIRPSTGYSFKNAERYVDLIIDNIKKDRAPDHHLFKRKYRFYDTLLLDILNRKNSSGPQIFEQMYSRNKIHDILQFLDGNTTLIQDLRMLYSFNSTPFIISIINQIKKIWTK